MENYCGTLRISNPNTLQKWIDNGWFKNQNDNGFIFSVGCGRFKTEKCECSACRKRPKKDLIDVLINNKIQNETTNL
jgi:hypothetical protein